MKNHKKGQLYFQGRKALTPDIGKYCLGEYQETPVAQFLKL